MTSPISTEHIRQELHMVKVAVHSLLGEWLEQAALEYDMFHLDKTSWQKVTQFTTSGKCFRGLLLTGIVSRLSTDDKHKRLATQAAALVELYEAGILIQDDVMDNDERRRGMPSIHKQIQSLADELQMNESTMFGQNAAICLGDVLFFLAQLKSHTLSTDQETAAKLQTCFADEMLRLGLAQIEDLRLADAKQVSKEDILHMFIGKTGRYSGRWPVELALIITQTPVTAEWLRIGDQIGLLYQLRDDYLGLFGDNHTTGKNTISDIQQGKKTLYWIQAIKMLPTQAKRQFIELYGNKNITEKQAEVIKQLLVTHQVTVQVNAEIDDLYHQTLALITQHSPNQEIQDFLHKVLTIVVSREK